jgi:hypothetical protein
MKVSKDVLDAEAQRKIPVELDGRVAAVAREDELGD